MQWRQVFRLNQGFEYNNRIILRDYLAMERTRLANERTLLAYLKASLYLLLGGIAFLQLEGFGNIKWFGVLSLSMSAAFVLIGAVRYYRLNKRLRRYYSMIKEVQENKLD